jgi:hypothetical protein
MTTFVTSLLYVHDNIDINIIEKRVRHFRDLAETGIQLCIYLSNEYIDFFYNILHDCSNVKIAKFVDLTKTEIYQTCFPDGVEISVDTAPHCRRSFGNNSAWTLPDVCNPTKDTAKYIISNLAKTEFMYDAIQNNPWNSTHFAWIDSSITELFKTKKDTLEYVKVLAQRTLAPSFLAMPGYCNKISIDDFEEKWTNAIYWRFLGAFFLGDIDSVRSFCTKCRDHFPGFLKQYGKLVWEVNYWAWVESIDSVDSNGLVKWYKSAHNDSIFRFSADYYAVSISEIPDSCSSCTIEYNYPPIRGFYPMSASYIKSGGKNWLNTRYVNYWLHQNGGYVYTNSTGIIENKNILSELDEHFMPISFHEMTDHIDLPELPHAFSKGIEDIRLYKVDESSVVLFIGTNINHTSNGRPQMINGIYDIETKECRNCRMIARTAGSLCEKNWTPLTDSDQNEYFIYRWSPMEIGQVNEKTNMLEIVKTYPTNPQLFGKVRGSTTFTETADGLVGLVHFSEEHLPRHYYHMLVLLEKNTFRPLKYSEAFYFQKLGVEFCIGMAISSQSDVSVFSRSIQPDGLERAGCSPLANHLAGTTCQLRDEVVGERLNSVGASRRRLYRFWISRLDRDPMMVTVPVDQIPLKFYIQSA